MYYMDYINVLNALRFRVNTLPNNLRHYDKYHVRVAINARL